MKLNIEKEPIELQSLLKYANIVPTGGFAKILIQSGAVSLNGETETRRKKKIVSGDIVTIDSQEYDIHERIEVQLK